MKNVLGVKVGDHDPGAALVTRDLRVFAISEERLNRIKHSFDIFPSLSIDYVLNAAGIGHEDVDLVVIDKVTGSNLDVKGAFQSEAHPALASQDILLVNHHDSHAASAAYCSGFDDALVVVIDGAGEAFPKQDGVSAIESMTVYEFLGGKIKEIDKTTHDRNMYTLEYPFTMGLGKMYTAVTRYIGFGRNQEGKTMGLAPYGGNNAELQAELRGYNWMKRVAGRVYCNPRVLYLEGNKVRNGVDRAKYLLRYMRSRVRGGFVDGAYFDRPVSLPKPIRDTDLELPDEYYTELAYCAQQLLEEGLLACVGHFKEQTGHTKLCTAGGVALNIDANSRLYTDLGFKDVFTQPASNDSGIPLGNALYGYYESVSYKEKPYVMRTAYLAQPYSDEGIEAALAASRLEFERVEDVCSRTAQILADNKIVGWFQGASEYGPRALGNRSILMSPLEAENKDVLNLRIKKRESFRPFAPITLLEKTDEYFDMPAEESRFMLLVGFVKEAYRTRIPAITHVDNSARVQTLTRSDNPVTYDLIKGFGERTGISVLLNTSFNLAGEPIVETPSDAIGCYERGGMDYLVMGNYVCWSRSAEAIGKPRD